MTKGTWIGLNARERRVLLDALAALRRENPRKSRDTTH